MMCHHGKFVSPDTFDNAPLLYICAKSAPHVRGMQTRAAKLRARVAEVAGMLRAETRGEMQAF